jgi:NitT/TauT family transport system substrate-binding protein
MAQCLKALVIGCAALVVALAAPGAAFAIDKVKLLISTRGPLDCMLPLQAQEEGFFKAENLDVEFTYAQGGAETVQALSTGGVDLTNCVGILSMIAAYGKGAPVRILSNGKRGAGELYWYVRSDSPLKTLKDLDGKTLAYSRPGSTTHLVTQFIIKSTGIKPKLVSVGGMAPSRTQVMSGQVDTGWASFPFQMELMKKGEARILFTGEAATELNDYSIRVVAANTSFLKARRDVAVRFMRAYHKAVEWMYDNPGPAFRRWATSEKLDPELVMETPKYIPKSTVSLVPIGNLEGNITLAVEFKMLPAPLTEAQKKELVDIVFDPGK